ncbi:MAG: adenylate/guanylate cyclase domain-containing protein, partial [Nitrososphaerales archaeon]
MGTGAPSGTVTFLFTDIEGSTSLWEAAPDAMRAALERHDSILRSAIDRHDGYLFSTGGDGFAVAFARAGEAVAAAMEAQQGLTAEPWPQRTPLRVRMGLHTGEAAERAGDYFGTTVNRAARLMAIAHGGQVLVSRPAQEVLGAHVDLVDLGEHHLRDLSHPEHVFQLVISDLRSEFPPLRSVDALPGNLPVLLTTFIGREEELKHLGSLVADHRLVTVTGVGGVGKTRVALQLGAELLTEFSEGVWFCELATAQEEDALGDVIAVALRAPARPGISLVDSVVEFLRIRKLLLLMDNCEHLLTAAGDLIERVLKTCPGVRIVATSREGLGIPGEQLWPLRSLPTPSASDSVDVVVASDAVQLFVLHATSLNPSFILDDREAPAIGEICRRLDGIPLAIELAAARAGAMAPVEIASLLDERFRLLTGGRRRSVERHHTLRATVDWSYSLLEDSERKVFDRLGVFSGTFDAAAAQAVAASEDIGRFEVLDALAELVGKSMLDVEQHEGLTRYQMLETLRQYALEKLDHRSETDEFRRRHARYFSEFAREVGPTLLGPAELEWRPKLTIEVDNLRAAVGWAIDPPDEDDRELALVLLASLSRESVLDRGLGVGTWAERAVEMTTGSVHPLRSTVMVMAAYGAYHRGDFAAAESLAREVLAATRDSDPGVASWAAMALANIAGSSGNMNKTLEILTDVISWLPEANIYDRYT